MRRIDIKKRAKNKRIFIYPLLLWFIFLPLILPISVRAAEEKTKPKQRQEYQAAPKIANWNFQWSIDSEEEVEQLAKWDLIIADVHQEKNSRKRLEKIKEINPDIKIIAYISLADIRPDAAELPEGVPRQIIGQSLKDNPGWITHLSNGNPAEWWPTYYIMNVTDNAPKNAQGQRFNDFFPQYIREEVIQDPLWDGVFYDNLWTGVSFVSPHIDLNQDGIADAPDVANQQWQDGVREILQKTRKYAKQDRKKFIITGNGGIEYHDSVNGVAFEHFPNTTYGAWIDSMEKYYFILRNALPRQYAIINANVGNSGKNTDYKKFRYGLTSTLLSDGYYSFDNGDKSHTEKWYFDEYDAVLGEPISGAYNLLNPAHPTQLREGVWRRDYESASVIVNSTTKPRTINLRTGLEKIKGVQDPKFNSGEVIGKITIPAKDGIVLLQRLTQIRDSAFINGAYTKVFDNQGTQVRKSFFAHDGSFAGGVQIFKLPTGDRTVVAGQNMVTVYNRRNDQIVSFAPYGNGYSGGVNVALAKMGKKKKKQKYYIVTGPKQGGAQVKIYTLKGKVVNPGCFPYGKDGGNGINVAAGDFNGDGRQEILTAPGTGGAPHIQMINKKCKAVAPGFFAFPSHWKTGANIAGGDLNGDGTDEIIVGPGKGGAPMVKMFNNRGKLVSGGFLAYQKSDRSGVYVSAADMNQDGIDEIITSSFAIFNSF